MSRTDRPRAPTAAAVVLLLTALTVLLGAAPAQAHDYLVSSSPAAGSTVTTAPERVTLTFDAAVLNTGNGSDVLTVTGPDGKHFETACPVVRNDDVSVAVRLGPAGTYTVGWRVVSADGHPVADSLTFRYAPAAGTPTAVAGSASGPSCGDAAVRSASGSSAAPGASSSSIVVLIAIVAGVLVLLVVAGVVVAVVLTRRRA